MKTVRVLAIILGLVLSLVPAVVLRSGNAMAAKPAPTIEQITEGCENAVMNYAMMLVQAKQSGVPKAAIVKANRDAGVTGPIYELIDAIYDGTKYTKEAHEAIIKECVALNMKANAPRT